eukprot:CAMPEP_0202698110 /NCGR_PEP_ID=MMETSP1385-20130828/11373_1 /ASSEMBLY_ACC=CAM_ASM_000861 /TAXON_ID=933848 /ORGANISM="Elphidium margaritaceum" /LENGTH=434 /DNA_ID=CAMNT_0049354723 /DNA_START=67 /DNA_END=1371 /DNA_ORIENTATION=+
MLKKIASADDDDEKQPSKLPVVYVSGKNAYEIGVNHGQLLREDIRKCFGVYLERFTVCARHKSGGASCSADGKSWDDAVYEWIRQVATSYIGFVSKHAHILHDVVDELKGIAEGSKMELWKIYVINARGELFGLFFNGYATSNWYPAQPAAAAASEERIDLNECTTVMSKKNSVLSQNWDWLRNMEEHIVLLNVNHEILTMVECGMIGKVGFNKHGLGITINSLHRPPAECLAKDVDTLRINAIPIHLIIRHLLNAYESVQQIRDAGIVSKLPVNRFIGIGILDKHQDGVYVEYCGLNHLDQLPLSDSRLSFHANHFLGCGLSKLITEANASSKGTHFRMKQLEVLYVEELKQKSNKSDIEISKLLLTNNQPNNGFPVFRSWVPSVVKYGEVGTVCSIVMDLKKKVMHITRDKDVNMTDTAQIAVRFDQISLGL